jgi:tRNA-specific 2-thiouridylase
VNKVKALSLFSGGLDSILATRLVMAQGVEVEAIQFVTPFFNYHILEDPVAYARGVKKKFGITVSVEDISEGYLQMLHQPGHGFGKNFNPCIDCKIMMFSRARSILEQKRAAFLISGEVLGQRPMSQRRDTLNVIERDSATTSLLLRPLSAGLLKETEPEIRGWVDRSKLMSMRGRGRSAQIALAKKYGITQYPAPAGGCTLADPILGRRIKQLYTASSICNAARVSVPDVRALLVGRQLMLPRGGWLIVGRDEKDNKRLLKLVEPEDALLHMEQWAGPTAILKKAAKYSSDVARDRDIELAASLVVRYGKKLPEGIDTQEVICNFDGVRQIIIAEPFPGNEHMGWVLQ